MRAAREAQNWIIQFEVEVWCYGVRCGNNFYFIFNELI